MNQDLFLNTLTFSYPTDKVTCYFSIKNDNHHKSDRIMSRIAWPKEVKAAGLFEGAGNINILYASDSALKDFHPVEIDFNDPDNENFVKRYYNHQLLKYLSQFKELIFTKSGITNDLQVWVQAVGEEEKVDVLGSEVRLWKLDRFTIKVRFDSFNKKPYILISNDRPARLLNTPLSYLFNLAAPNPFDSESLITASDVTKVMTRTETDKGECERRIYRLDFLQSKNIEYNASTTRPILSGALMRKLKIDTTDKNTSRESKYVRYLNKITYFKDKYLSDSKLQEIFPNLASDFTKVNLLQIGATDSSKRMLRFGNGATNAVPQIGINNGPARKCPYADVRLIGIVHNDDRNEGGELFRAFHDGNYKNSALSKRLSAYIGTSVSYSPKELSIIYTDSNNPLPEIRKAMLSDAYLNRNTDVKYVGIYFSPINKYTGENEARECYYKVKELFLNYDIPTQCIDVVKMKEAFQKDETSQKKNYIYSLQNMAIAICAKLCGLPWLLDEAIKKELIIGIGTFRSDNCQYIGAAFSFDNTGAFHSYSYYQKSELKELVGAIKDAIIRYRSANNTLDRIIIHYYKKLSRKREFILIENMLNTLNLDIPVYVVSINKTESEDIVLFDKLSSYIDKNLQTHQSLMPFSGCWINLGEVREGQRYLLCNNTRYNEFQYNKMDGFPFPVKLTITCPNHPETLDESVVNQLIDQVYQFSRIYWKSIKQQGLPVTIKYPEMIAEIMPHFDNPTAYSDQRSLWFL